MNDHPGLPAARPGSTASSLLERARAQEPDAWRRLVALYGPLVYHWCRGSSLGPEDVADVFQEVFRAVAAHLVTFSSDVPGATFRGWLLVITRNKVRDHLRRQRGRPVAAGGSDALRQLGQAPDPVQEPDDPAGGEENRAVLRRALELVRSEFEEATWQAFWRATVEDHAPADVARDLGLSVNAVYKAKSRVLRRLRTELEGLIE
jgi:RNA polymerase sigma-70 factor (ECF subfamily)